MNNRTGWLVCCAFAVVGLLTVAGPGCKRSGGGGDAGGKVKLQLNWKPEPQFGGFYAAQETGIYKKRGLDVEVVPGGVGTPTVQMVGAGSVPFAVVSADEVVIARANGNDVVALFAAYQTCPQGIMVRKSRGFRSIADVLANEGTVAMQRGLPYARLLETKFGFDKVKVVPSPGGDLSLFLKDEKFAQQCFVTSEPLAARRAGVEPQTFLVKEAGYDPYTTVLVTSGDYLRKNPQTAKKMVQAVREGWQAYLKDPAATNAAMQKLNPSMDAQTFGESAEVQRPLIETEETKSGGLGTMTRERWQTLAQQLADLKVIPRAVPAEECFADADKLPSQEHK
jgi:NitT/TauT family transport system substrate-binding protein